MRWKIVCDSTELAVECLHEAGAIGLSVDTEVHERWLPAATGALDRAGAVAVAVARVPSLDDIVELAHAARYGRRQAWIAILPRRPEVDLLACAAADLGVVAVADVGPLVAAVALCESGAEQPWGASTQNLPAKDRVRLGGVVVSATRAGGVMRGADGQRIAWAQRREDPGRVLGDARDVALAIAALHRTDRAGVRVLSTVDDIDARDVTDVLFGPRRALSDPASKAALRPYGIPIPVEELCTSPSRAATEATRIGFPVRIALASPDLRVWDHPDLCVDMVDSAARARDAFHQLVTLARARLDAGRRAEDRVLGVVVSATAQASALLGVRARPLPHGRVATEIGFADPHGQAAGDTTLAVLPAPVDALERALGRLRGASLLLPDSPARRKANLDAIGDVLLRLAAFVHDRREDVESAELRPLAVLPDGSVEVREACVHVSDAFERSLAAPSGAAHG
jgi:hypothetical protein